ncbi:transposase [Bradyrhizobium sp. USDA 3397]
MEIAQGILGAAQEKAEALIKGRSRSAPDQGSRRNRGCLPAHLPRVERIIEPASTLYPCGCGAMTKIGKDVSKRLGVIPAKWRGVGHAPSRRCSGPVVQAHAPEHVVPSGLPTEVAIAHVVVSKFGDHTPFYRQSEIYARQGIRLDRRRWATGLVAPCFIFNSSQTNAPPPGPGGSSGHGRNHGAPVLDPGRG